MCVRVVPMRDKRDRQILKSIPLFASLGDDALDVFLARCAYVALPDGAEIITSGDRADAFFAILAGRVKVYKLSSSGNEQILHTFGASDVFAEAAMLAGQSYPASARTLSASRLLKIPRTALVEAFHDEPEIALAMLAGLAQKLRQFARLIEQLALKEVPARVAGALLELSERLGASVFTLPHSKRQLAAEIGTVAETLSRAFRKLQNDGLIKLEGNRVTIIDSDGLRQLAET